MNWPFRLPESVLSEGRIVLGAPGTSKTVPRVVFVDLKKPGREWRADMVALSQELRLAARRARQERKEQIDAEL